jgi:hypothetical protein
MPRQQLKLVHFPPFHSKYNPIERTWAILEHHWNGAILDSVQTALNLAQTMTWKGKPTQVKLIQTNYSTGIRLTKQEMAEIESQILRLPYAKRLSEGVLKDTPADIPFRDPLGHLPNWFVDIFPDSG